MKMSVDLKAYLEKRGFKVLEVRKVDGGYAVWLDGRARPGEETLEMLNNAQFKVHITETYGWLPKPAMKLLNPYYKIRRLWRDKFE